jgi:uroporphyrinogen III methyltransferase/synthase
VKGPLSGKRVVVTRARDQASSLVRLLADSGATVVEFPTIRIEAPESFESLDRAIHERWDWLMFTSANGVRAFFERLKANVSPLAAMKVAAVGETTAAVLREYGIKADLVPAKSQSITLLPHFPEDLHGVKVAIVRAEKGRDELGEELLRRGADVHLAVAYRTVADQGDLGDLHDIDVITFSSPSTVDNFYVATGEESIVVERALIVSIGPSTTEALLRHGRRPDVEAANASVEALHEAVLKIASVVVERLTP